MPFPVPFSRKVKPKRNASANHAVGVGPIKTTEPEGAFHESCPTAKAIDHGYLPKTSACTDAIDTLSQRSICPPNPYPVTGTYSNVFDDYEISPNIIGKGQYGIVYTCTHRATRRSFAVKSIDKSKKIGRLDHLRREVSLLAEFDHYAILKMVDCYEDEECIHIVTEKYTGGELFDAIVANASPHGCLSEHEAGAIVKSLLEAVACLHDKGVVHRDVKPENVLFESDDYYAAVRLIDFGLAQRHHEDDGPMTKLVGTAYYMSPELLDGEYDKATDVWSIGVVAYILLCGYPPFNGGSDKEIQEATRSGTLHFRGRQWADKNNDATDFVRCLLTKDPRWRLTAREALMHPWIRSMMTF